MSVGSLPSARRRWLLPGFPVRCHTHHHRGSITTAPVSVAIPASKGTCKSCLEIPPCGDQKPASPGEQKLPSSQQSAGERCEHWWSQFSQCSSGSAGFGDGAPMTSWTGLVTAAAQADSAKTCPKFSPYFVLSTIFAMAKSCRIASRSIQGAASTARGAPSLSPLYLQPPQSEAPRTAIKVTVK